MVITLLPFHSVPVKKAEKVNLADPLKKFIGAAYGKEVFFFIDLQYTLLNIELMAF